MTETIDMGAIDIYNADLQAIVCHACYTASVRRLDLQGPSPTVPLDQPNWIQRASQFSVNIDLDMGGSDLQSTDLDMAVESIAQALEVASIWGSLSYQCSSSISYQADGQGRRICLHLTSCSMSPLRPKRVAHEASVKMYGEATEESLQVPRTVKTYSLEFYTVRIRPKDLVVSHDVECQRHDSLFSMEDDDVDADDWDLFESKGSEVKKAKSSTRIDKQRTIQQRLSEAITYALIFGIASGHPSTVSHILIQRHENFRSLLDLAPSICKPEALRNLVMHTALLPSLEQNLRISHDPSSIEHATGGDDDILTNLWGMLHGQLLQSAEEPKLESIGSHTCIGDSHMETAEHSDDHGSLALLFDEEGDSDPDLSFGSVSDEQSMFSDVSEMEDLLEMDSMF